MIQVYANAAEMNRAAAELFVERAREAVERRGRFVLVLSGGNTPRGMYQLLAKPEFEKRVSWGEVHVFWGDERCVPPEDERSNQRTARMALLDHVPVPGGQVHVIGFAGDPEKAVRDYEAVLRGFFGDSPPRFDLVLLGLGKDGHTASLLPATRVLKERKRWVAEVYEAEQGLYRVTMTAPLLNRGSMVVFLVTGREKAEAVRAVLEGARAPRRLPAQLIRPRGGEVRWMLDEEAASLLSNRA